MTLETPNMLVSTLKKIVRKFKKKKSESTLDAMQEYRNTMQSIES